MKKLIGTWEIQEMETWDADYFNMEVQAYITIKENNSGQFQFGLVSGYFSIDYIEHDRVEFEWEGNAEMDEASGSGWVELKSANEVEGYFSFRFMGEKSMFTAIRKK